MKVLFLPDGSRSNPYQRELAEALKRHGVDVTLSDGIGRLPILGAIRARGKPDILHLHWTHGFLIASSRVKTVIKSLRFLFELLVVKFLGIKIVWTVHNLLEHERHHPQLELFFNRILVRLYDHLIVHCSFAREAVIQTYRLPDRSKAKISIIPHGHYINSYENKLSQEEARARMKLAKEDRVFLYLGQIRPYKGVLQLIDTFRKLESPQAKLVIAGKPANEAIEAAVKKRCRLDNRILTFLQFVPDREIQLYMNAADVAVFPYQDILTSGAALLAMSFGKPIIIPNIGCVPEIVDCQGGFLYDPSKEEGLLEALKQALGRDLATMGKHNIDKARNFDWDVIAQKTVEVYQQYLSSQGVSK
ncbi:MAG: glycosyltransferase family 4 protein [Thermoanaerobacteraceae bacterium]|nr:glycosyltransferase family 4 protein [Thermoanaerobacteraceae bacterium]